MEMKANEINAKYGRAREEGTGEPVRHDNPADGYLPETTSVRDVDLGFPELCRYRSAGELLEEPEDMTEEERKRLVRIRAIPEPVRMLVQTEIGRIAKEVMEMEKRKDMLIDYLNGEGWDE